MAVEEEKNFDAPGKTKPDTKPSKDQAKIQPKGQAPPSDGTPGEKKLSNAELKKKAKEEKAARRAQAKTNQIAPAPGGSSTQGASGDAKSGSAAKGKGNHLKPGVPVPSHHRAGSRSNLPPVAEAVVPKARIPECFSHLPIARRIPMTQADKDVNPVVLALGQQMSTFAISDSITRLETTLLAFKKVIESYSTPHKSTLSRHFTSHVLNPQIEYLTACRPMCFSMGNAIRWLKLEISKIDIDLSDADAKTQLCQSIDNFIRERIVLADYFIAETAADEIKDGSVVLTYAHHKLVERTLLRAKSDGRRFRVIVVDDAFDRMGIEHAKVLADADIPVTYLSDLGGLRSVLSGGVDVVLVGAEAMFGNGSMYARAGTCDVAAAAAAAVAGKCIRTVALCQTINFTERVAFDSLTYNEIDPDRCTDESFRLLFDTTPQELIDVVLTEQDVVTGLTTTSTVLD